MKQTRSAAPPRSSDIPLRNDKVGLELPRPPPPSFPLPFATLTRGGGFSDSGNDLSAAGKERTKTALQRPGLHMDL